MPQGITEFANAGMLAGLTSVNFNEDPYEEFNGFYGAMSTYGSFSYLKYGPVSYTHLTLPTICSV